MSTIFLADTGNATSNGTLLANTIAASASPMDIQCAAGNWYFDHIQLPDNKDVTIHGPPNSGVATDSDPLGDGLGPYVKYTYPCIFNGDFTQGANAPFSIADITYTPRGWPGVGQTWADVGGVNGAFVRGDATSSFTARRIECWTGYGPSKTPYDPAFKYPEFNTPNPWYFRADGNGITDDSSLAHLPLQAFQGWGDAVWMQNNAIAGPYAFIGRFGSFDIEDCYIHDHGGGWSALISAGGKCRAVGNWTTRCWLDNQQWSVQDAGYWDMVDVHHNIYEDPVGNSTDNGNPHQDIGQSYGNSLDGHVGLRFLRRVEWYNCMYINRYGVRTQAQFDFAQASANHNAGNNLWFNAQKIDRYNIICGANKAHEFGLSNNGYVLGSIACNMDWQVGVSPVVFTGIASTKHSVTEGDAKVTNDKMFLMNSVLESWFGDGDFRVSNCVDVGKDSGVRKVPLANVFTSTSQPTTIKEWYDFSKPKGIYAGMGPQAKWATVREYLTERAPHTGEPPHIGVRSPAIQTKSATPGASKVETALFAWLGGDRGDIMTLGALPAGVEVRHIAEDMVTELHAYSTTQLSPVVGSYGQLRLVIPDAYSTTVTYPIVLNGVTFPVKVATKSNIALPRNHTAASSGLKRVSAGWMAAANSGAGEVILVGFTVLPGKVYANVPMFVGTSGRTWNWNITSDGTTFSFTPRFNNGNGTQIVVGASGSLTNGTLYDIQFNTDMTVTPAVGFLSIENRTTGAVNVTGTSVGTSTDVVAWGYNQSANVMTILPSVEATFEAIMVNVGEGLYTPWDHIVPEYIGPLGEGLTRTGKPMDVFILGDGTGLNRGSNATSPGPGVWAPIGSLVTDNSATWPPVLQLNAEAQTDGPFHISTPITLKVSVAGVPQSTTLTPHTTGTGTFDAATYNIAQAARDGFVLVTYTPTASGDHAISFTNDKSYTNPGALTFTVTNPYTYITAGQTATLTKDQALSLEAVTAADDVATGVGPATLRWHAQAGETGATVGEDILFNIIP